MVREIEACMAKPTLIASEKNMRAIDQKVATCER